jgi:hypothetical protein
VVQHSTDPVSGPGFVRLADLSQQGVFLLLKCKRNGRASPDYDCMPLVVAHLVLPRRFVALDASLLRWPFVEYCAHSLSIEPQTESIFLRKLRDFFFSIFLVYGPNAFQVVLVNQAVLPHATHLSFDLFR